MKQRISILATWAVFLAGCSSLDVQEESNRIAHEIVAHTPLGTSMDFVRGYIAEQEWENVATGESYPTGNYITATIRGYTSFTMIIPIRKYALATWYFDSEESLVSIGIRMDQDAP